MKLAGRLRRIRSRRTICDLRRSIETLANHGPMHAHEIVMDLVRQEYERNPRWNAVELVALQSAYADSVESAMALIPTRASSVSEAVDALTAPPSLRRFVDLLRPEVDRGDLAATTDDEQREIADSIVSGLTELARRHAVAIGEEFTHEHVLRLTTRAEDRLDGLITYRLRL